MKVIVDMRDHIKAYNLVKALGKFGIRHTTLPKYYQFLRDRGVDEDWMK